MNKTKENEYNLTLNEIVLNGKEGEMFVGENFKEGVCFKIGNDGDIKIVTHDSKDDINPQESHAFLYKSLFNRKYKKVYTRQSLFND